MSNRVVSVLMLLRLLPLLAGLGPLCGAYLAFWIGVNAEVLPACIPFIDGCASISATGRKPPGSYLFRAIMFPQSVLLLVTWFLTVDWMQSLDNRKRGSLYVGIRTAAIVSSIALILYVTFLGTRAPFYEFMRSFGIYLYFLGLALAEIFVAAALLRMPRVLQDRWLTRMARLMLALCVSPFLIGLLNLYLKATLDESFYVENVIEWIAATLMQIYLVVMYFMWHRTGMSVSLTTRTP